MDTEIKNAVNATDGIAQYDENVKRLLGNKYILAHILIKTIDEFRKMTPEDVVQCIEGEPQIGIVPVEPGMTNSAGEKQGQKVIGFNTENIETNEGLIRFDIVFYVRMKDGISQIIVNIEAQKDEPSGYDILNRAVFYVSRLVSSQKERDFVKTNYNDIRRVFSIWICMGMEDNTMNHIHLTDDALIGSYKWKGRLDLINIVMIGLSDELPAHDETYELHRLLGALVSKEMSAAEKLDIIETEYGIPVVDDMRKDVSVMCNLGEGLWEKAQAETNATIMMNMYNKGYTLEQIADIVEKSIEEVKAVIDKRKPVMA